MTRGTHVEQGRGMVAGEDTPDNIAECRVSLFDDYERRI
jgi:hypothetical protein